MIRNIPTLADLQANPDAARGLPLDALAALLSECDETRKTAEAAIRSIVGYLVDAYRGDIQAAFDEAEKDYGTVHIAGVDWPSDASLEVTRDKKVEWDQAGLAGLAHQIEASGENPRDYVKAVLTVEERKYASWPAAIRDKFDLYRTTKPGSVTVKLTA